MNREVALGLLSVANTGNDILAVLDVIQSDTQSDNQGDAVSYITGESVTFWVTLFFFIMGVKWIHKGGKSRPDKRTLPKKR